MQSSSEQPLDGEEHCVTTLITAAKETTQYLPCLKCSREKLNNPHTIRKEYGVKFPVLWLSFSPVTVAGSAVMF